MFGTEFEEGLEVIFNAVGEVETTFDVGGCVLDF